MRLLHRLVPGALLVSALMALAACQSAEERAEEHYQNALALVAEGDVARATVELRNVFRLDPGRRDARLTLAELQLEQNNRGGAYRSYLRLAEQDPDDLESRIILSELAFLGGDLEEFLRHGTRAEELAPEDPRVQVISLVRTYRETTEEGDAPAVRALGDQAGARLAEQPENGLLHSIVVDSSIRRQDFERALASIDWLISDDPRNSRNYQERLRILAWMGDEEGVEAQLRELVALFPDDQAHKQTLIQFYLSRQNLDAAETFLRELAEASGPDDPGPTLDLIRFLLELRGPEAAQAEIADAIATRPDPAPFQAFGASLDFTQGRRDEGIAALQAVLEGAEPSEQTRDIKITLARMLRATGDEAGARVLVADVLSEAAEHPGALKMQAAWQIEADDTEGAISGLRIALDQAPRDAEAMTLLAGAYARAGQPELARDLLARAVEASGNAPAETLRFAQVLIEERSYLPAEDLLLAALRRDRTNLDLLLILGDLYLKMEDYGRAQGVADALRRMEGDRADQAANEIEAGRLNQQRGLDQALAFLEDLSETEDATLATRISLVQGRLIAGDTERAITLVRQLKEERPGDPSLDVLLAAAHSANGDLDVAASLYRDLLEETPAQPSLWLELSLLELRQEDRATAKAMIDEGLTHTPEAANLLWGKASFLERDGEIDAAIEIYERLYAQNSSDVVVANNLANLLATYREDDASLERAWRIARRFRDAEAPPLQDTFGWILHRRGDSAEALPYLEAAAAGLPGDPVVQYRLGQVYVALDRSEDALAQLRKALAIAGPVDNRPEIQRARNQIQDLQNAGASDN